MIFLLGNGSLRASKAEFSVELCGRFDTITAGSIMKATHVFPVLFHAASRLGAGVADSSILLAHHRPVRHAPHPRLLRCLLLVLMSTKTLGG